MTITYPMLIVNWAIKIPKGLVIFSISVRYSLQLSIILCDFKADETKEREIGNVLRIIEH